MANARNSHGNSYGIFISPEGWRNLAGGNTPGNDLAMPHPERVPESTVGYPIRPISPIRPNPPCHPWYKPLIKVENGLSQTSHRPIIRPENKGIQSISNRHRPKIFINDCYAWGRPRGPILYPRFVPYATLRKPTKHPPPPRLFLAGGSDAISHGQSRLVAPF